MYACIAVSVSRSSPHALAWFRRDSGWVAYSVLRLNKGIVDGDDLDVLMLEGVAEDNTSNAAEAIDADLQRWRSAKICVPFGLLQLV